MSTALDDMRAELARCEAVAAEPGHQYMERIVTVWREGVAALEAAERDQRVYLVALQHIANAEYCEPYSAEYAKDVIGQRWLDEREELSLVTEARLNEANEIKAREEIQALWRQEVLRSTEAIRDRDSSRAQVARLARENEMLGMSVAEMANRIATMKDQIDHLTGGAS